MENPSEIQVGGKTLPLWTKKQLEGVNAQTLRLRALDLKDATGLDGPVPRHTESLIDWILSLQDNILRSMGGVQEQQYSQQERQPQYQQRAPQQPVWDRKLQEWVQPQAPSPQRDDGYGYQSGDRDRDDVFDSAHRGAREAKSRNQGTANLLSWN
jgi:hypothetical protein